MTATDERIAKVQIRRGFEEIIITLDTHEVGFEVAATRLYCTSHGANVGNSSKWTFSDLDKARAAANGYYNAMIAKGWTRIRPRQSS